MTTARGTYLFIWVFVEIIRDKISAFVATYFIILRQATQGQTCLKFIVRFKGLELLRLWIDEAYTGNEPAIYKSVMQLVCTTITLTIDRYWAFFRSSLSRRKTRFRTQGYSNPSARSSATTRPRLRRSQLYRRSRTWPRAQLHHQWITVRVWAVPREQASRKAQRTSRRYRLRSLVRANHTTAT